MKTLQLALLLIVAGGTLKSAERFQPGQPNALTFPPVPARFVRLAIPYSPGSQPCIDELELYGPDHSRNLALAAGGAVASASSCLPGYAIHQIAHLNDGRYGNSHSWIAAGIRDEWAQIQLPKPVRVSRVVFSRDREGRYRDRLPGTVAVRVSVDGTHWTTVARVGTVPLLPEPPVAEADLLRYAFECEDLTWRKIDPTPPVERVLRQMTEMLEHFARQGLDVSIERAELSQLQQQAAALDRTPAHAPARQELYYQTRLAKRRLFFRAPALARLRRVLFVKRQPFEPSHNYSVILDAAGDVGGGICVLDIPRRHGRLEPGQAKLITLFDAGHGIARNPVADCSARRIYFSYRKSKADYFHLYSMRTDGGEVRQLTDGPFHDFFPCPLPDGGLAFMSTRCKARFLCWRPQAFVLFRLDAESGVPRPLSHANLSEWAPSVMRDGRILWTRSEYLDKGADFGHTLWAIRPDGTHPELVFGNNTRNCYANGREVPGTGEIVCTLISHGGDLNGPIALIDPARGRFNPAAITSLTPDVAPQYHMSWARQQCFRDPVPIDADYFLCSHAAFDRFGLYVIDRFGNRELLYLDPHIGSMAPSLLAPAPPPPVLGPQTAATDEPAGSGRFVVADVYRGLEPAVPRGRVKFIRVCQELRAGLRQLPNGEYQKDHEPFQDWYATPTHKVSGPHGWPSYVAKGVVGLAPVEADGSAHFHAPAGRVLYFQALDADFNELQRMRSVVQLQPGEQRGCIGCHEHRMTAPPARQPVPLALRRPADLLEPPPWGAGPFDYQKVVQPVWDAKCASCHNAKDPGRINLTGVTDADGVPASYRTIIERGWVHYFDYTWGQEHHQAAPLTFGTVRSTLWRVLENGHYDARLTPEEQRRVKCWTDLNCPLWPDYQFRLERLARREPGP